MERPLERKTTEMEVKTAIDGSFLAREPSRPVCLNRSGRMVEDVTGALGVYTIDDFKIGMVIDLALGL
jgi:hypothetical protein